MNREHISHILSKYWEGESTLDEEITLREYFSGDQVAQEHAPYRMLFQFYQNEKQREFDLTFPEVEKDLPSLVGRRYFLRNRFVIGAAASLVVLICALFAVQTGLFESNTSELNAARSISYVYETDDPEEALEITRQALGYLSIKIQDGQTAVSKNFSKIQKIDIVNY